MSRDPTSCSNEQYALSILQNEWPSKDEQRETLEKFYYLPDTALENAIGNVTACKTAVVEEIKYAGIVQGQTMAVRTIAERSPAILIHLVFVRLHKFADTLDNYVKRHNGGLVTQFHDPQHVNRRRRHSLTPLGQLELEFIDMKEAVNVYLNSTEEKRNERFWEINYDNPRLANFVTLKSHSM